MLGHWVRKLADGGLVAALTATSPARLGHPEGGPPLAGTNPLAIAIPSSDGHPVVADVSMGRVTYGEVLAGEASEEDLVPFGGEQAHKAFALAIGLQLLVDALAGRRLRRRHAGRAAGGGPGARATSSSRRRQASRRSLTRISRARSRIASKSESFSASSPKFGSSSTARAQVLERLRRSLPLRLSAQARL